MRGCLASLGNDGILELFALNVKIAEIVFSQWDLGKYQERILMLQLRFGPQEVRFNTPSQVSNP